MDCEDNVNLFLALSYRYTSFLNQTRVLLQWIVSIKMHLFISVFVVMHSCTVLNNFVIQHFSSSKNLESADFRQHYDALAEV